MKRPGPLNQRNNALPPPMSAADPGLDHHARNVLQMLALRRHAATTVPGTSPSPSPFAAALTKAGGRFIIGQRVLTPGIDECSPKVVAEVMHTGTRADQSGIWCLLRYPGQALPSVLIREDALSAVVGHEALDTGQGGLMPGTAASR
jgi:hypothetical protein